MKLFLAIDLTPKIKKQIEEQLTPIKREYPQLIWKEAKNFHITVYFFGETRNVNKIKNKLDQLLFDQESFYLYATNCGIFIKDNITLYLSFRREKKIEQLEKTIRKYFNPSGLSEIKFVTHMTFAKGKIPSKQQYFVLKKKLEKYEIDTSFLVKKVTLFESIVNEKNITYKKVIDFPLL